MWLHSKYWVCCLTNNNQCKCSYNGVKSRVLLDPSGALSASYVSLASSVVSHWQSLVTTPCFTKAVSVVESASGTNSVEVPSIFSGVDSCLTCNSVPSSLGLSVALEFGQPQQRFAIFLATGLCVICRVESLVMVRKILLIRGKRDAQDLCPDMMTMQMCQSVVLYQICFDIICV